VLSREEFRALHPNAKPENPPVKPPGINPAEVFAKADTDGDGSLSPAEFKASPFGRKGEEAFRMLDRNGDGKISHEEFIHRGEGAGKPDKPQPPVGPEPVAFGKLDTDGDGVLSLDEFMAGPAGHKGPAAEGYFRKLDRNGDGHVSHDEFYNREQPAKPERPLKPGPPPAELFRKLDTDQDGKLTLDEVKAGFGGKQDAERVEARFQQLDADQDSLLSLDEFAKQFRPKPVDGGGDGPPPVDPGGAPE